jgi:hypothetical protein
LSHLAKRVAGAYTAGMRIHFPSFLLLAACGGADKSIDKGPTDDHTGTQPVDSDPTDTDPTGACGSPINYDMTLVGFVLGGNGEVGDAASLSIEDRGWQPGRILGTGTTDSYGAFTIPLTDVTSVEDCWGTLLDYVLVGQRTVAGGEQSGELGLNTLLFNAIQDGTFVADLGSIPFRLENDE